MMPLTTLVTLMTLFQVLLLGQRTVSVKFLLMRPSSKWTGEHRISNDGFFSSKVCKMSAIPLTFIHQTV